MGKLIDGKSFVDTYLIFNNKLRTTLLTILRCCIG